MLVVLNKLGEYISISNNLFHYGNKWFSEKAQKIRI